MVRLSRWHALGRLSDCGADEGICCTCAGPRFYLVCTIFEFAVLKRLTLIRYFELGDCQFCPSSFSNFIASDHGCDVRFFGVAPQRIFPSVSCLQMTLV